MHPRPVGGGRVVKISATPPGILQVRIYPFGARLGIIVEPREIRGQILTPNRGATGTVNLPDGRTIDVPRWQHVESVFTAFRQAQEMLAKYGIDRGEGERLTLYNALRSAITLNSRVLGLKDGLKPYLVRRSLNAQVQRMLGNLTLARNENKRSAKEQLEAISSGTDARGRVNRMALAARSVAVQGRIRARLQEIERIEPRILHRQEALLRMIKTAELWIDAARDFLVKLDSDDLPLLLANRKVEILAQCLYLAGELDTVDYHPYYRTAKETAIRLRELNLAFGRTHLTPNDFRNLRSGMRLTSAKIKIRQQHIRIERLIYRLSFRTLKTDAALIDVRTKIAEIDDDLAYFRDRVYLNVTTEAVRHCLAYALRGIEQRNADGQQEAKEQLKQALVFLS